MGRCGPYCIARPTFHRIPLLEPINRVQQFWGKVVRSGLCSQCVSDYDCSVKNDVNFDSYTFRSMAVQTSALRYALSRTSVTNLTFGQCAMLCLPPPAKYNQQDMSSNHENPASKNSYTGLYDHDTFIIHSASLPVCPVPLQGPGI